jgi:ribonuclease E
LEKIMVVNALEPEETRIAVLEDKVLEGLRIERTSKTQVAGNIYKGRVTAVEPSFEASFIDMGLEKNGFLHVRDVKQKDGRRRGFFRRRLKKTEKRSGIKDLLKKGDEVVVQVTKEGIGSKGHAVTGYLSIPGRYLVMMPGVKKKGVSRKIEDQAERDRLRAILGELDMPEDIGFIVRTLGIGRTKEDFKSDLDYLMRLWTTVGKRMKRMKTPSMVYQESDLITRVIRDTYTPDVSSIVVDKDVVRDKIEDFLKSILPDNKTPVKLYDGGEPIFHKYGIEEEIEKIYIRKVPLKRGGSLVLEPTEAMVTIDVNSGRYKRGSDSEETAYQTNLDAAPEVARQIRLRNLGGLVVVDFIDMERDRHRAKIQQVFEESLARDRARIRVLKMSRFGLVELTRQRIEDSLESTVYEECPTCRGRGLVKTEESTCLEAVRKIRSAVSRKHVDRVEVAAHPTVATHLQNTKRADIAALEDTYGKGILIRSESSQNPDEVKFEAFGKRGGKVEL